jgi:hypothetical protein
MHVTHRTMEVAGKCLPQDGHVRPRSTIFDIVDAKFDGILGPWTGLPVFEQAAHDLLAWLTPGVQAHAFADYLCAEYGCVKQSCISIQKGVYCHPHHSLRVCSRPSWTPTIR